MYALNNNITYFDNFGVEHVPNEIIKLIKRSLITKNIYRIQAYDSVICGYFYIGFLILYVKGKSLTDFTNIFSPNN